MKALIIDNEQSVRQTLISLLHHYCKEITHITEAGGVQEGLEQLKTVHPDIVFLDIEMDDGTGFDLVRQLNETNFQLIFITAHDKYALEAFRFSALDFLVKPVDPTLLIESVEKAKSRLNVAQLQKQLENLTRFIQHPTEEAKIVLRDSSAIYFVKIKDIIRCESQGAYTEFFLQSGERIVISKTIKEFDELLSSKGFIRVHQSHLVQQTKVVKYDRSKEMLLLDTGDLIPLSQRKKDVVLNTLF